MAPLDTSVAGLKKLREASKSARTKFEPNWFLNLAFYADDQWVFWNRGRLDRPKVPNHRILVTDNRIKPVVQTRIAKKLKNRPVWTVTPNSSAEVDVSAAELGEVVVEFLYNHLDMDEKLQEVLHWADICCAGFWKVTWDKTLGDSTECIIDESGQPMMDQNGHIMTPQSLSGLPQELTQGLQSKTICKGDIRIDVRSPFEIFQDPLATRLDECEWLIEEVIHSPEYVKAHYGATIEGDTAAMPGIAEGRFIAGSVYPTSSTYKGIKVSEFWAKPSSQFPKGKYICYAKDKVLYEGDNPYDGLPYVMFTGSRVPGRFWPQSIVDSLRGLQTDLNKIKSQIRENAQRVGNPALLMSRLSNVEYSGVPGEEIRYDDTTPNSVPTYLQPPQMPPYVLQEIDRIQQAIEEVSGQHEPNNSQGAAAGMVSAAAINLQLEKDDTRLGPTISDMETQLGRSGSQLLVLVAQYYDDERMLRTAGEDGDWDIKAFKGDMLRGHTTVSVQAGSQFPASKAAKQAAMQSMLTLFIQNGQPLDSRSLRKFFKDYQVGGLDALFDDLTDDVRQVNRENRLMQQGQPLDINIYDNDQIHLAQHDDFMKGSAFARLDPNLQQIFLAHRQLHVQRMQQAQTAQLMQQGAAGQMMAAAGGSVAGGDNMGPPPPPPGVTPGTGSAKPQVTGKHANTSQQNPNTAQMPQSHPTQVGSQSIQNYAPQGPGR